MKKTFKMIAITTIMLIVLTSCGDKENQTTTTKANGVKAQTTVINVTDKDGKEVTNADGKAVTEVVKVTNGTTKKVETTKATTSTAPTTAPTPKTKVTTTRATTTARPTTTVPTTTVQANPYGYVNAWGSIATMENDCKAYAESLGMTYRADYTMDSGHWITPKASYGFSSPEAFKNRLCGGDTVTSYQQQGFTNIRYLLVTMSNYQDGRCGQYQDLAKQDLGGNKDLILVYIIAT